MYRVHTGETQRRNTPEKNHLNKVRTTGPEAYRQTLVGIPISVSW